MVSAQELPITELQPTQREYARQIASLLLEELGNESHPTEEDIKRTLREEIEPSLTLAAVDNKAVVGTGGLRFFEKPNTDLIAAIVNVVVVPRFRRRGLGGRIVGVLEEVALKQFAVNESIVRPTTRAVPLYERLGYRLSEQYNAATATYSKSLNTAEPFD